MLFCQNKSLNPLQRRFGVLFSSTLILTAVFFLINTSFGEGHLGINPATAVPSLRYLVSALPILPFFVMMFLIPRYLRQEKDEFVRMLVIRSLLLGFAVPMVVDTVWGFLWRIFPVDEVMPMMNVDLFCITAMLALRLYAGRYQ